VVDEVITDLTYKKWLRPLEVGENPIDALFGVVQSTSLKPEDVQCGCALNNLSQEMSPVDERFRTRTGKIFALWTDTMASALRRGQQPGLVKEDLAPRESATFLIAAYEGYLSLAKNSQDAQLPGGRIESDNRLSGIAAGDGRALGCVARSAQSLLNAVPCANAVYFGHDTCGPAIL
jgi:hypothetical protein